MKLYEVSVDVAFLGKDGSVLGTIVELSGVARLSYDCVKVVFFDIVVVCVYCNDVLMDNMLKMYVVGCDLDDVAFVGRRVEVDY